jgi:hypothetical protein
MESRKKSTIFLHLQSFFTSRAIVWLIDCWWRGFQQAEGGPGFGAVVVKAGVETFKAFHVVESQYGSSQ